MTVKELIDILKQCDQNKKVYCADTGDFADNASVETVVEIGVASHVDPGVYITANM